MVRMFATTAKIIKPGLFFWLREPFLSNTKGKTYFITIPQKGTRTRYYGNVR